jgi:hypothetical protein
MKTEEQKLRQLSIKTGSPNAPDVEALGWKEIYSILTFTVMWRDSVMCAVLLIERNAIFSPFPYT